MSTDIETLHSNEWVSLLRMRAPECRCAGRIVAVLPYRIAVAPDEPFDSSERLEYLVKLSRACFDGRDDECGLWGCQCRCHHCHC